MGFGRALLAAALLFTTALADGQAPQWKTYDYPEDGFAASFPSLPDLQKKDIETPSGTLELRSYVAGSGDAALMVGVCDYSNETAVKDPDQRLQGAMNSAIANSGSNLLNERKIAQGGNQGIAFEGENNTTHFIARFYMIGTTLYQTLVIFPLNKPFNETSRFLDSFQPVPRTKGKSE
jgi:hypothetical protein